MIKSECNVYEVEVLINNIEGHEARKLNLKGTYNVLAISEDAAQEKCANYLKWEHRNILEHKKYTVSYPAVKLLVPNVVY